MPASINVLIDLEPHDQTLNALRERGSWEFDFAWQVGDPETSRELPRELISGQEVLFCQMPPANLMEMGALKLIQVASAGFTQIVGLGLPDRGIRACNSTGVFDTAIAEWNLAMMVNLVRDAPRMMHNQKLRRWDRDDPQFQKQLFGSTVGIWGYGGIGRQTARLCKAAGLTVWALTRHGIRRRDRHYCIPGTGDPAGELPDRVFTLQERQAFLRGLDFLILSMPLSPENEGIVGQEELRALPRHAYVLNPSRGPLIRERALLDALQQKWIAGAALDTHYQYPLPPDHPLWTCENAILTPHISGSSSGDYFLPRVWDVLQQNLYRYAHGEPLLNEISPEQLG